MVICEDILAGRRPIAALGQAGVILCGPETPRLRAEQGRRAVCRCRTAGGRAGAPLAYVNLIGGQDELCFDGRNSAGGRQDGALLARAPQFVEHAGARPGPAGRHAYDGRLGEFRVRAGS